MSPEEIEAKVREARQFEEQDKVAVRLNQVKLQLKEELEAIMFFHSGHPDKLDAKDKKNIKELAAKAEAALKDDKLTDLERLLLKTNNIREKINTIFLAEFET